MAMKDPLTKLFGSAARVKIMRLCIAQADTCLTIPDIIRQTKTIKATVQKEIKLLEQIGFLKKTKCKVEKVKKLKKSEKVVIESIPGVQVLKEFEYFHTLKSLLTQISSEQGTDLSKRIRKTGRIKGLIVAGVFLQDEVSRVDILIVGDAIKHRQLETAIRTTEAELGQSLRYAVFATNEFKYRLDMRDKLICDILDTSHNKLINRLDI
jgi:hypothetical protein